MAATADATTSQTPGERLRMSVLALEKITGRPAFVFVCPFDHLVGAHIEGEIERVFGDDPPKGALDVVLESDGGSADAAYKAVLLLRQVADDVRVLVPRWAKSAATLFSLGADVIVMREAVAELGPLDVQVIDPRNPVQRMSALDGYQSVEYLRDYALQTQDLAVRQIMDRTRALMPLRDILSLSEDFAVDVISPIMSSVKPLDFGGWGRTLDIGKVYAERLLAKCAMAGRSLRETRDTADRLVYGYPHHAYVIDVVEALSLGLAVEPMDTPAYRACLEVVDTAFTCRVATCDGEAHISEPGYCGFAPPAAPAPGATAAAGAPATAAAPTKTGKEAQTNGSDASPDAGLRKQRTGSKQP